MINKLLAIKVKMGKQDADISSCNKLQIDIKKIVYNSSSEVIADLTAS